MLGLVIGRADPWGFMRSGRPFPFRGEDPANITSRHVNFPDESSPNVVLANKHQASQTLNAV